MANLAIGATGNCVVNTLMNTFFKTYKRNFVGKVLSTKKF
jgi:hypothetical protein